jgi:protein-S-isoprenylcysteine O-methyltransferase Ste14
MYTFRKKGGVAKGKSYIHTTKLVDTGIYSIVRHPQYLAGLLLTIALMLVTQHWLSVIAGIIAFIAFYLDTFNADPRLIEKFGEDYRKYMDRVPRLNFILGIIRKYNN